MDTQPTTTLPPITEPPPLSFEAMRFYSYLRYGKHNAIKASVIEKSREEGGLGYGDRMQQRLIEALADHGLFVCSSCSRDCPGYYLPERASDMAPFITTTDKRIMALHNRKEKALRRYPELRPVVMRVPPQTIRRDGNIGTGQLFDFEAETAKAH